MTGLGRRRALSMIEVTISAAIVGVMLVAALQAVMVARVGQFRIATHARGALLAQDLLAEIMRCPYVEPGATVDSIGPDAGETGSTRAGFDDLDDYHGWTESPPRTRTGESLTWAVGYERVVEVVWVRPEPGFPVSADPTGLKRITVMVRYLGTDVATLVALRSAAGVALGGAVAEAEPVVPNDPGLLEILLKGAGSLLGL
ncbi:MAG: hypothetical protein IPM18_16605 [Phycisphaerales bacterium]|nr:hypothetical protein [Phycisphaerales bacterium]